MLEVYAATLIGYDWIVFVAVFEAIRDSRYTFYTCFAIGNTVNVFKRLTERGHFG